jgi:hypothetical protein
MPDASTDRCLSPRQLAAYWRCAPARVRALARRGILRGFQLGRAMRFSPEAIREAERLLAAPAAGGRRVRHDRGISPAVIALLEHSA